MHNVTVIKYTNEIKYNELNFITFILCSINSFFDFVTNKFMKRITYNWKVNFALFEHLYEINIIINSNYGIFSMRNFDYLDNLRNIKNS